jgi:hypothetical protein
VSKKASSSGTPAKQRAPYGLILSVMCLSADILLPSVSADANYSFCDIITGMAEWIFIKFDAEVYAIEG